MEYFKGKRQRIQFKGLDTSEQTEDWAAAIAQWNGQRLPSSRPGFESHAHHIAQVESNLSFELECEMNEKRVRDCPI